MYLYILGFFFICLCGGDFAWSENNTELRHVVFKKERAIVSTSAEKIIQNDLDRTFIHTVLENGTTSSTTLKTKPRSKKKKRNKIKTKPLLKKAEHPPNNSSVLLDSSPTIENKKKTGKKRKSKKKQRQNNTVEISGKSLNDFGLIHSSSRLANTSYAKLNIKNVTLPNPTITFTKRNRCNINNGGCSQICRPKGKKKCSCTKGYVLAKNRKKCVDLNECRKRNGGCQEICRNTLGAHFCECRSGFRLSDDLKSCYDVNECYLRNGHGPCQGTCKNTHGSYICDCSNLKGSRLSVDKHTCEDIDECKESNPGCSHLCINTRNGAFCHCPEGMELMSDYKTCQDVDECEDVSIRSLCLRGCVNTVGSYYCEEDFQNDYDLKKTKIPACPPLDVPQHGFITCQRNNSLPFDSFTRNGRKIIKNSPGTKCRLECPVGFKLLGGGRFICGLNGKWIIKKEGTCIKSPYPKLQCPPDQLLFLKQNQSKMMVQLPPPQTNIRWKIVTSYPTWAKDLKGELGEGRHNIQFSVTDPASKLSPTCSFLIIVNK